MVVPNVLAIALFLHILLVSDSGAPLLLVIPCRKTNAVAKLPQLPNSCCWQALAHTSGLEVLGI